MALIARQRVSHRSRSSHYKSVAALVPALAPTFAPAEIVVIGSRHRVLRALPPQTRSRVEDIYIELALAAATCVLLGLVASSCHTSLNTLSNGLDATNAYLPNHPHPRARSCCPRHL